MKTSSGLYTDFYELTMAQGYLKAGKAHQKATFDYFFRSNPFGGSFTVFAGLPELLEMVTNLHFSDDDLQYLQKQGFDNDFLDYLQDFSFSGTIEAPPEGTLLFPNEPAIRAEGDLAEVQILETLLLNIINFQSLIATKAARIRIAAGPDKKLIDFGLRRSQGYGGLYASRAAIAGGFDATSNVLAGKQYNIPVTGTMAHSWIQSFDSELEAFREYARHYPNACIILVDTYDTLKKGIPDAIKIARELEENGHKLLGIRLDSGDLMELSIEARKMLDEAGLDYVKIAVSNQMDEYIIKDLTDNNAPVDVFGVGTRLVTAKEDPALDGVYKLANINGRPNLKLSETKEKITLPGRKKIARYLNESHQFVCDVVMIENESPDEQQVVYSIDGQKFENDFDSFSMLRSKQISNGSVNKQLTNVTESVNRLNSQLKQLPAAYKKLGEKHLYPVYISEKLNNLREELIEHITQKHTV